MPIEETPAEQSTVAQVKAQQAARVTNYDDLLEGLPEAAPGSLISEMVASSQEVEEFLPIRARVWVPGLRLPGAQKFGVTCTVVQPSPDEEIAIYAKAREKETPEDVKHYLNLEHLPARGRVYRMECIWKLVYCLERPTTNFAWAAKIMSLKTGSSIVRPLIDRIDELMAIRKPIDQLTDGNIFAYPTLLGDAKVAARDGKLAEYFGSLPNGVAATIRANARTMTQIQLMVAREDAELWAAITEVVRLEIQKKEYEPTPAVAEALRDPLAAGDVNRWTRQQFQAPEAEDPTVKAEDLEVGDPGGDGFPEPPSLA